MIRSAHIKATLACLLGSIAVVAGWPILRVATGEQSPRGGTIQGTVTYEGDVPRSMVPDANGVRHELLAVDRDGGLRFATVYLTSAEGEGLPPAGDAPPEPAVIDQRDYRFVPSVVAVRSGQPVRFTNSDQGNHNVRGASFEEQNQFNTFTGPGGSYTHRFRADAKGRPVRIGCDIHAWMTAWVYVFDHPWFAVTDAKGRFSIRDVPPGRYLLLVRQPDGGLRTHREVTIATGETVEVKFDFREADLKVR